MLFWQKYSTRYNPGTVGLTDPEPENDLVCKYLFSWKSTNEWNSLLGTINTYLKTNKKTKVGIVYWEADLGSLTIVEKGTGMLWYSLYRSVLTSVLEKIRDKVKNGLFPNKLLKHYIVTGNKTTAVSLQTTPFGRLLWTLNKE